MAKSELQKIRYPTNIDFGKRPWGGLGMVEGGSATVREGEARGSRCTTRSHEDGVAGRRTQTRGKLKGVLVVLGTVSVTSGIRTDIVHRKGVHCGLDRDPRSSVGTSATSNPSTVSLKRTCHGSLQNSCAFSGFFASFTCSRTVRQKAVITSEFGIMTVSSPRIVRPEPNPAIQLVERTQVSFPYFVSSKQRCSMSRHFPILRPRAVSSLSPIQHYTGNDRV